MPLTGVDFKKKNQFFDLKKNQLTIFTEKGTNVRCYKGIKECLQEDFEAEISRNSLLETSNRLKRVVKERGVLRISLLILFREISQLKGSLSQVDCND